MGVCYEYATLDNQIKILEYFENAGFETDILRGDLFREACYAGNLELAQYTFSEKSWDKGMDNAIRNNKLAICEFLLAKKKNANIDELLIKVIHHGRFELIDFFKKYI